MYDCYTQDELEQIAEQFEDCEAFEFEHHRDLYCNPEVRKSTESIKIHSSVSTINKHVLYVLLNKGYVKPGNTIIQVLNSSSDKSIERFSVRAGYDNGGHGYKFTCGVLVGVCCAKQYPLNERTFYVLEFHSNSWTTEEWWSIKHFTII